MSWGFFSSRTTRAAKLHRCAECSGAIEVGDEHQYCAGKVEGYFESYRLCETCSLIVDEAHRADLFCEGWGLGGLRQELAEEHSIPDAKAWAEAQRNRRRVQELLKAGQAVAALVYQGGPQ